MSAELRKRLSRSRRGWTRAGLLAVAVVLVVSGGIVLRPLSFADALIRVGFWRAGIRSRYVVVDGVRLHYFEALPSEQVRAATPVLLVHGLGARGDDWGRMLPDLAKAGFHVYAPDLPGYGRSGKPDIAYTIADEEAAMAGFLRAMQVPHADVLGWSMGGWVAMKLAAEHPALVNKLVLYDSAGVYFDRDYDASLFTPTDERSLNMLLSRLTPKPVTLPGFIARDFLRRSKRNAWVIQRSVAAMTSGRDLMEFRLNEIKAPTAVMWGMSDRLIPPAAGEKIARGIPGAVFVPINGPGGGCGHLAPAECEPQVLPATVRFLRGKAERADGSR